MGRITLPTRRAELEVYETGPGCIYPAKAAGPLGRIAYAAAHVVADPTADVSPWLGSAIDPGRGHIGSSATACAQGVRAMGWEGGWGDGERRENHDEGRDRSRPRVHDARRQDGGQLQ